MSLGYGILGSVFFKAPEEYQWILTLMSPFYQMFIFKVVLTVAYKSAGKDLYGNIVLRDRRAGGYGFCNPRESYFIPRGEAPRDEI